MPEYHLPMGSFEDGRTFAALDLFTQGYIEAMFFTDASDPDDGDLQHATFADLAPETLTKIMADCAAFRAGNAELLERAYELGEAQLCYNETRAGHDFWLTRNGHGAGFWDRGLGEVGDALSKACGWRTKFGEVDIYLGGDDKVYLS